MAQLNNDTGISWEGQENTSQISVYMYTSPKLVRIKNLTAKRFLTNLSRKCFEFISKYIFIFSWGQKKTVIQQKCHEKVIFYNHRISKTFLLDCNHKVWLAYASICLYTVRTSIRWARSPLCYNANEKSCHSFAGMSANNRIRLVCHTGRVRCDFCPFTCKEEAAEYAV